MLSLFSTVTELGIWMFLLSFFLGVFVEFLFISALIFGLQAAVYFDDVKFEQVAELMAWGKVLSYKIDKYISNFCFDIKTK